ARASKRATRARRRAARRRPRSTDASRTSARLIAIELRTGERRMDDASTPFDRLGAHVESVATDPLVLGALAVAAGGTAALSATRADHALRLTFARDLAAPGFGDAMNVAGIVLPTAAPLALWISGMNLDDASLVRGASAAMQAAAITIALTAGL